MAKIKFSELLLESTVDDVFDSTHPFTLDEELYKSIVIDRKNRDFKLITGDFPDKKAMINTYDSEYLVKRVYNRDVFDWIEKNAKSVLDGYLLFSIALSKWKNNNMLKDYYNKIVHDIPNLNLEDESAEDSQVDRLIKEAISLQKTSGETQELETIYINNQVDPVTGIEDWAVYDNAKDCIDRAEPLFSLTKDDLEKLIKYKQLDPLHVVHRDQLLK